MCSGAVSHCHGDAPGCQFTGQERSCPVDVWPACGEHRVRGRVRGREGGRGGGREGRRGEGESEGGGREGGREGGLTR